MLDQTESRRSLDDKRLAEMQQDRTQVESLWKELRDSFMPNRGRFSGEENNRIKRVTLLNNKPTIACRTTASGLHAGLTSPARPWQKSTIRDDDGLSKFGPVKEWLAVCDARMMMWYAKSGLYQALPFMYAEYAVFGTMCGLLVEDDTSLFRVEPFTVGQYYLARNERGVYDTLARQPQSTVRQLVSRFGKENVSPETRRKWEQPSRRGDKVDLFHLITPDSAGGFDSVWYETAHRDAPPLKRARYTENPILAASWEYVGVEPYASNSPGMMARGDARALQIDERNKSQAIERSHNPPLQGPAMTAGINLAPGSYNRVDAMQASGQNGGIRSVYDFRPDVGGLLDNIARRERRIDTAFYVDLFLMITMDERTQRATAEEIRAKYDEKVLALGPTLEQANVMLRSLHSFVFNLMVRKSIPFWRGVLDGDPPLPKPPEELMRDGIEIEPEFISALQQAQRAQKLQGLERYLSAVGAVAQLMGKTPDKFDDDKYIDSYADGLGVDPTVNRDDDEVAAAREQQAQQAQMQQMAAMAPALKDAAGAMRDAGQAVPQDGSVLQALGGAMG